MDAQWSYIVEKILNDQCVVVLGPQLVPFSSDFPSLQREFEEYLKVDDNPDIYRYYPNDNLFLFDHPYKRTLVCHRVKKFYENRSPSALYEQLAKIPFHIYLSVTPDKLLSACFDKVKFNYQYGFYKKHDVPLKIRTPTSVNPLLYNVFGSIDSEESIILNHDDLFDYFKSIFARESMPELLKVKLREAKNIIFLGLDFEKWYMQLLLRELEFHKQEYQITKFAAGSTSSYDVEVFCKDQFSVHFVNNDINNFVSDLLEHIPLDSLRVPTVSLRDELSNLKKLIGNGELEASIEKLKVIAYSTEYEDDVYLISSKLRKFKRRTLHQLINANEAVIQESNLTESSLSLISEMLSSQLWK